MKDEYRYRELGPIPSWARGYPISDIQSVAGTLNIDPAILIALFRIETAGDSYRCRFEPRYKNVYYISRYAEALKITFETEEVFQKTSFGLGQILGSTARTIGFSDHLTKLCNPSVGCYWSGFYLCNLIEKYQDVYSAASAYNAGSLLKDGSYSNPAYVAKFKKNYLDLRKPKLKVVT